MKAVVTLTVKLNDSTTLCVWQDGEAWYGEIDFTTSVVKLGPMASEDEAKYQAAWLSGSKQSFTDMNWEHGKRIIPD